MFDAIARVLAFFYELPVVGGSYGVAIILLTAAVMVVLMPLTLRATRSQIKMQEVQPKLKALQKEHKDDKQTLNSEMMKLYQEQGINPVGGCLPMVAQLPVFLVLFNVLRGLSRRVSEAPFFTVAEHARVQAGGSALDGQVFDPKYISHDSQMYLDLARDHRMAFGPFDLAAQAKDVIQDNILHGIPYLLLILFVVGTSYYQQRQITARRSGQAVINPQQEMIMKFMPLLSGVWSFAFPAGLVLYWATSNAFRIGQQSYITRAYYSDQEDDALGSSPVDDVVETTATEKPTKGGGSGKKGRATPASSNGTDTDDSTATNGSGRRGRSGRGGRPVADAGSANGSADDQNEPAAVGGRDRNEAWAQRRKERARSRDTNSSRSGESSRVTPKGTKPSGTKKKRKR